MAFYRNIRPDRVKIFYSLQILIISFLTLTNIQEYLKKSGTKNKSTFKYSRNIDHSIKIIYSDIDTFIYPRETFHNRITDDIENIIFI